MRRTLAAAAVATLLVAGIAAARETSPVPGGTVELGTDASVMVVGAVGADDAGTSVARAGDVNGDGDMDLIVGAPEAGDDSAGRAYVIFGPLQSPVIDLAALGEQGFAIVGEAGDDHAGYSVAAAGDVNHDGHADVIVGAPSAAPHDRAEAGAAYVVFGKSSTDQVELGALGARGFRIEGAKESDFAGFSVSTAGDVDRDGLGDVIVGAPALGRHRGYAAVVFGRRGHAPVDLGRLGAAGIRIQGVNKPVQVDGQIVYDETGASVALAGDVNGDRRPDLVIGSPGPGNGIVTGNAYVVFMPAAKRTVEVGALGFGGFRIQGAQGFDYAGESVAAAGDVNSDGFADVITGGTGAHAVGFEAGAAYVVFGKRGTSFIDLQKLAGKGFRMDGAEAGEYAGWAVAGAGNAGGDDHPDVFVGAPGANGDSGSAYVILGQKEPKSLNLADLGSGGFRLQGLAESDFAGASVANVGDMNGDGQPDLAVGAPAADFQDRQNSGAVYVVFVPPQRATPPPPPPPPLRCLVPAVKGKTLAVARERIKAQQCSLGKVSRAHSARVRSGVVLSQRPSAGTVRQRGAKVALVVSLGPRSRRR
ncbi:MAG: FG-GAP repeat protein [Actinobacteria bacterium]|nr:FG-GAP repeat protein [Actinomycetota bacterium]